MAIDTINYVEADKANDYQMRSYWREVRDAFATTDYHTVQLRCYQRKNYRLAFALVTFPSPKNYSTLASVINYLLC